jgi:hypothetical protein
VTQQEALGIVIMLAGTNVALIMIYFALTPIAEELRKLREGKK